MQILGLPRVWWTEDLVAAVETAELHTGHKAKHKFDHENSGFSN